MTLPSVPVQIATARPRRPARVTITPWGAEPITTWTLKRVQSALAQHEHGDFTVSAALVDAMGRDDRITACLGTRTKALTSKSGAAFSIEPSESGDRRRAKALAREVSAWWIDQIPETTTARILRDGIMMGVSISRVEWETGSEWLPRVTPWPMQYVTWDETEEAYAVQAREGRFIVRQNDPSWLVYTPGGWDRAWMYGLVRALAMPWLARTLSYRDWMRFGERHGLPIIKVKEPANSSPDDAGTFASALSAMGREGVIRLPQLPGDEGGFDVEFIEPRDTSWQSFESFRSDLASSIAIVLLGQNLTTDVQGGSFAAAQVQDRVRADYLASDAETLSTCMRSGLLVPWLAFNYSGVPLDTAPWLAWETGIAHDAKADAEALKAAGDAIAVLLRSGVRVDVAALAERLGIPMLPGDPLEDDEPEPTQPAEPTPPADVEPDPEDDDEPEAMHLASGDSVSTATGFVDGQRYIDAVVADATRAAQTAIRPTVDALLRAIDSATTWGEARAAIAATYATASTDELETIAERAYIIARLSGHAAVMEDL